MKLSAYTRLLLTGIAVLVIVPLVNATALRDPTRPYSLDLQDNNSPVATTSWTLKSTLISPNRRVAVINNTHVIVGESIGNATVLEIGKLHVLLQTPGKRITLQLLPDIVKTQP